MSNRKIALRAVYPKIYSFWLRFILPSSGLSLSWSFSDSNPPKSAGTRWSAPIIQNWINEFLKKKACLISTIIKCIGGISRIIQFRPFSENMFLNWSRCTCRNFERSRFESNLADINYEVLMHTAIRMKIHHLRSSNADSAYLNKKNSRQEI